MPRILQNAELYAVADFQREVRKCQGACDLMSVRSLASAVGIPHTTLRPKLNEPGRLTVADCQKLVHTLHPDPNIILALLGYSHREIKKLREENHE